MPRMPLMYGGILEDEVGQRLLRAVIFFANVAFGDIWESAARTVSHARYAPALDQVRLWSNELVRADVNKTCLVFTDFHSVYRQKCAEYYIAMHPERLQEVRLAPQTLEMFCHKFAVQIAKSTMMRSGLFFDFVHIVQVRLSCADILRDVLHGVTAHAVSHPSAAMRGIRDYTAFASPMIVPSSVVDDGDEHGDEEEIFPADSASNIGGTMTVNI